MARPLCAICVRREANTIDDDGALVCFPCRDDEPPEPPEPPTPRDRALAVLRRFEDGADIGELCHALGEPDNELAHGRISAVIQRAVKAGLVTFTGHMNNRTYFCVRAPALELTSSTQAASAPTGTP